MLKDPTEFRKRFAAWKDGKLPYKGGRPSAISEVDKSDADFAERLRSNWRQETWDWEGSGKAVTHKIGSADNIVYPNVQTTKGGGLIDFTNPIWKGVVDPLNRAIINKDYVPMKTELDAIWFGPNYKEYYPKFKDGKFPGYGDGKPVLINGNPTNALFNSDGTFTDDITKVFDDFYVTPFGVTTKYGSHTDKNWDRYKQQERFFKTHDQQTGKIKYEPGLEIVSPEFDLLTGVRGIYNITPSKNTIRPLTYKKAKSLTDELWDLLYYNAVKTNNKQEIQNIRDLHFKIKSPLNVVIDIDGKPIKTYHTVSDEYDPSFNAFKPNIEGDLSNIYTTDNKFMSGTYSSHLLDKEELDHIIESTRLMELESYKRYYKLNDWQKKQILILSNPKKARRQILKDHQWLNGSFDPDRQKLLYIYLKNPVVMNAGNRDWAHLPLNELPEDVFKNIRVDPRGGIADWYSTRSLENAIKDLDYDGAVIKNVLDYGGRKRYFGPEIINHPGTVFSIKDPKSIKYANAITYDDAGNIIPISKRDNFNITDLRYGIIPTLIGGSAYLMYK